MPVNNIDIGPTGPNRRTQDFTVYPGGKIVRQPDNNSKPRDRRDKANTATNREKALELDTKQKIADTTPFEDDPDSPTQPVSEKAERQNWTYYKKHPPSSSVPNEPNPLTGKKLRRAKQQAQRERKEKYFGKNNNP